MSIFPEASSPVRTEHRPSNTAQDVHIDAATRLLVAAPHPDDETIGAGGLIQQVRAAGGEVRIVLFTDGDNNPWPQRWLERRVWIGAQERRRWGQRRRGEVVEALRRLGVPADALTFMAWPDMGVTAELERRGGTAVAAVAQQVALARPSLIALPALDDRHPDHGSCHVVMRLALAKLALDCPLLGYLVHGEERETSIRRWTAPQDTAQLARKLEALSMHASQTALSGGRLRRFAGRPERYQLLSAAVPATPLPWHPPRPLHRWLRLTVAEVDRVQTWRWTEAPLTLDGQGRVHYAQPGCGMPRFARLHLDIPSPWIFDHWGWCAV